MRAEAAEQAHRELMIEVDDKLRDACVYRKLKLGRSGGEVRQGWRVI